MMQDTIPTHARPHEMTAEELSERAAQYVSLAKAATDPDDRDTFERLAELCRTLAVERTLAAEGRAEEQQDDGSPTAQ